MKKKVLELFAGSRSIGKVADELGFEVFSSDINDFEGIDYPINILDFNPEKVPFIPDIIWGSPPCTYFSIASVGKHWNEDKTPKTKEAVLGMKIVKKTLEIIKHFEKINPNLKWYMENPRGNLRKLELVRGLDRTTITYCRYADKEGNGDKRMKPTDIWSNNIFDLFNLNGWRPRSMCFNNNKKCQHEEAPRGSHGGTQGIKGNYSRSKIPYELCKEILTS